MRGKGLVVGLLALVLAAAAVVAAPIVLARTPAGSDGGTSHSTAGAEPSSASTGSRTPTVAARPIRVAVVGDSLSAGSRGFLGDGLDERTWMTYAQGGRVQYVGGWARAGATPNEMAASVEPVGEVDVLVVLAGTNAVRVGRSLDQERASYDQIVATIAPRHVIVSSIPPYVPKPAGGIRYNRELRGFVQQRGWDWFDAWGFARDGNGWKPGYSLDGVHPATDEEYRGLGRAYRWEILDVAGR